MSEPDAKLRAYAITRHPRGVVPLLVSDAVHAAGGWVAETIVFGQEQVVVRFDIGLEGLEKLRQLLTSEGFMITDWNHEPAPPGAEAAAAITVTLISAPTK